MQPTVEMVLRRYRGAERAIGREDAEDVTAIVTLRVLRRLQSVALDVEAAIASLADFTATLTYNAIYDVFRTRHPERTRLRNRVRHTLARDPRLATWETAAGITCGLVEARGSSPAAVTRPFDADARAPLGDVIAAFFSHHGHPVTMAGLVDALATSFGISEGRPSRESEPRQEPEQLTRVEQRQQLEHLWKEIRELSPGHRAALLLNLRETGGGSAVALLIGLGIASIDDVAAAAGLTVERLAALWSRLPLDDLTIAEMLGVTRQQVINYRRSARERLMRRTLRPPINPGTHRP